MDDCKRREETGDKPLRRVSSTGLRHGSPESKVPNEARSQQGLGSLGAGGHRTYRVVSKTPMKAVMVTSMGKGDLAVRGRPFTLRGNCARSGRTWQTII